MVRCKRQRPGRRENVYRTGDDDGLEYEAGHRMAVFEWDHIRINSNPSTCCQFSRPIQGHVYRTSTPLAGFHSI